jgi:hypothetical protein
MIVPSGENPFIENDMMMGGNSDQFSDNSMRINRNIFNGGHFTIRNRDSSGDAEIIRILNDFLNYDENYG